jgi:hypothetical protein
MNMLKTKFSFSPGSGGLKHSLLGLSFLGLSLLASAPTFAAGTAAGTTVNNKATLNFSVGGVAQPVVNSSPTGNTSTGVSGGANTAFVVDRKVDLQVVTTDSAANVTVPGAANVAATFKVTNLGNAVQDFALQVEAMAIGTNMVIASGDLYASTASTFVVSNCRWATAASAAALPPASTPASFNTSAFVDELAPDGFAFVRVICDMPSGPPATGTPGGNNGDLATIALIATAGESACAASTLFAGSPTSNVTCATTGGAVGAALTQTGGAETPAAVDTVFGDAAGRSVSVTDGARDARHSARDAYRLVSAQPKVTKTESVFCDPFNFGTNPKSIPGAIVKYSIRVENVIVSPQVATDVANALLTTFSDILDGNLALVTDAYTSVSAATCAPATGVVTTAALINVTGGGTAVPARTFTANPTGIASMVGSTLSVTYNNATTPILPAVVSGATAALGELRAGEFVQVDFYVKVK